jgi:hypothetical protein
VTFLKTKSRPYKTSLPPPWFKTPSFWFKTQAPPPHSSVLLLSTFGHVLAPQPLFAPSPEWDGKQMVDCGGNVGMPLLPRRDLKPP